MIRKVTLLVLLAAMVAGCASQATPTPTTAPAKATAAPTTPPEPDKTWKIALVIGLLGDRSFLDSAARGIALAEEQLPNVETRIIEKPTTSMVLVSTMGRPTLRMHWRAAASGARPCARCAR